MRKLIFFITLFSSLISYSQKEGLALIDSLLVELPHIKPDSLKVKAFNKLAIAYKRSNTTLGLQYGQKALTLAEKLKWDDEIAESYNSIGMNYFEMENFSKTKFFYLKALKATKNKKINSKSLMCLGTFYSSQGVYSSGLDYYFQSLKMCEELKDEKNVAKVLSNIGANYFYLNRNKDAIKYYEKALAINTKLDVKLSVSKNLRNIGNVYLFLKNNNKAVEYFNKAVKVDSLLGNKEGIAVNLASMSEIYFESKEYDKAIKYGEKSLTLAKEINRPNIIAINHSNLGGFYLKIAKKSKDKVAVKNTLKNATINSTNALDIYKNMNDLGNLAIIYNQLSSIEELKENFQMALEYHKNAEVYKDSIFNSDNKETIKNLEDKRAIELRDKEIKINKLTLENKEKQKWYFVLGISLLAIIGGLLFYQSQNQKKTNQKLQLLNQELDSANKVKARFFSILNHDLRGPVANLIHFLHLQKDSPELLDEETKVRMQNKTISGAENLLCSMEDILLWSKDQMSDFKPVIKNISVNLLFEDTKKIFSGYHNIQFEYQNLDNTQIFTDENYLKTIIRNLTSNAINAFTKTQNPTIIWKAWQENGNSFLSITDNGPGASQEKFKALYDETAVIGIKFGLGLHLIRDLCKAIDCEIKVDSKINEKTTFTLKIQQKNI